ncbi:MAG TPA: L,D-transpeptidase family protein, partial [Flavisolibacter sp.]
DSVVLDPGQMQITELDLTLHFFIYLQTATHSKIRPEQMQWFIPRRKINEQAMLDSFISSGKSSFKPMNDAFYHLQDKMTHWAGIAKSGGWPAIQMKKGELKPGVMDTLILQVKKRLVASGDYSPSDTGRLYTKELETAVKRIQRSYGIRESGIINMALVNKLNVKTADRLKQMKVNLERMRWMPLVGDGIYVNIPEFRLHFYHGGEEVLAMNIVCGKAATRTVIFSDQLEYIVFSPYWNVPPSIVRNELLPLLSSSYLRRHNMEITGYAGGLPVVRQKPGPSNALGLVKFLFPNRYNIYLHDTPTKQLFESEKRAFSHGCIRIQKPFEMARFLLRNEPAWTVEAITAAMHRTSEKWVPLKEKVPVYVVYFTSWVDEDGLVHFRDDVYGHDKRMSAGLFTK